jgi:hypothetical protein
MELLNAYRLFLGVAVASLIATTMDFALAVTLSTILQRPGVPRGVQGVGVAVTVLLPIGVAVWWIFRNLRTHCTRRETLAVAITFGLFAPISLAIGTLLAPIPGGYAAFLGRPSGLIGAFAAIVVAITLISLVPCSLALWITRRIGRAHQAQ